jgi:Domain of unknown function (DUF4194)
MALAQFAAEYDLLSAGEQALFGESVRRLLADGLIWREDAGDTRVYAFLIRRRELVADYLQVAGWELRHEERAQVFHVSHRDGSHRRRLSRDTTIWLLLMRLIYAEQRERVEVRLTRHPVVTVGELIERYAAFLPGVVVRKKSSLDEALRTLQSLKLVRAAAGGGLRATDNDQIIELLPTLEVVVPAGAIAEVTAQLRSYDRTQASEGESED